MTCVTYVIIANGNSFFRKDKFLNLKIAKNSNSTNNNRNKSLRHERTVKFYGRASAIHT
jgi:hypothetical protein